MYRTTYVEVKLLELLSTVINPNHPKLMKDFAWSPPWKLLISCNTLRIHCNPSERKEQKSDRLFKFPQVKNLNLVFDRSVRIKFRIWKIAIERDFQTEIRRSCMWFGIVSVWFWREMLAFRLLQNWKIGTKFIVVMFGISSKKEIVY